MASTSSPAPATPPATGDDCFPMKKWQFKLRKPSLAIHLARRWRVVQSAEPQRRMRDRDPAMVSSAHQLHAHQPLHDPASRCTGSLNKAMCTQDVEQTVQGCDWISTLPDDILIKVLSLLTVNDAAMTSCLSTRWRHLWKNVDNLILSAHNLRMQELELSNWNENPHLWKAEATKFVQKVNGLLHNHYGTRIKEFTVRFPLTSANASELDDWIQFAASASTEKLCLDLDDKHRLICRGGWKFASEPYEFLLWPFSNGRGCRLSELTLSNCSLGTTPEDLSGFSCLHYLSLGCVSVTDAAVSNIMSSCRALKTVILQYCWELVHLTITHSQLLKLAVVYCSSLIGVCIRADDLRSFEYMGHEVDIEYEYGPFLDILRVYFVEKNECPLDFISALANLPKLETLVLLFPKPVPVPRALRHTFRFANLKAIMLMLVTSWKGCICSLAYLLEGTPLLECFWLHGCAQLEEPCKLNMTWPEDLTFARLDTILIKGFSGESELMELLYFLLRRAPVLKTLQLEAHVVEPCFARMEEHKLKDEERGRYAREMALTHLAPKVPSTVAFSIT